MRYTITQDYHSSLCATLEIGRLIAGQTVELEPDHAELINSDSPGTLALDKPKARKQPAAKNRQVSKASKDR